LRSRPLGDDRAEGCPTDDDHVEVASRITEDRRVLRGLLEVFARYRPMVSSVKWCTRRERLRHGAPRLRAGVTVERLTPEKKS